MVGAGADRKKETGMATSKITVIEIEDAADLYERYPNSETRQPVEVVLDLRRGTLTIDVNPEIGNARPAEQYHGHVQTWTIPLVVVDESNALLAKIKPLAKKIRAGYSVVWNGNDHVADFSRGARSALDEIERLCEELDGSAALKVWEAVEYYNPLGDDEAAARELEITAETTDEQLGEIAEREKNTATKGGYSVVGISEHLHELRDGRRVAAAAAAEEEEDADED